MKNLLHHLAGWLSSSGAVLLAFLVGLAVVAEPLWRPLLAGLR